MSNFKLKDRIASYQEVSDPKLLNRVPLIICINGRSFAKSTELLDKPYCHKFAECILSTTARMCTEIEGALFGYQYNDEIVVVARNDQTPDTTPWYNNNLQKICSVTSSIATLHFNNCANTVDLNMLGEPVFTSQIFTVPTIMEAINVMIYKQQFNFHASIQFAIFYELLKKYDKNTIKEMLNGLTVDDKIDLLRQECNIDFNDYETSFKRGAACYKVPKLGPDEKLKNKWTVNTDLPIFTQDQSFLTNIFKNGADIFRKESL
jgi:tRNA(His) guanylyltransferase